MIEELRKKLDKETIACSRDQAGLIKNQGPGSDNNHHETIRGKEKGLELLTRELDDKVRFRPRAVERPGSGAGSRTGNYSERPHSRGGSVEDARSVESMERPRSRGTGGDDRRNFQGSKERGFFSNRNVDRLVF